MTIDKYGLTEKEKAAFLSIVEEIAQDTSSPMLRMCTDAIEQYLKDLPLSALQRDTLATLMRSWQLQAKREACLEGFCLSMNMSKDRSQLDLH